MEEKFTDLILIMGTNPLPNFVATEYFIQTNKHLERIWIFCSEKTEYQNSTAEYAKNLETIMRQKYESIEFEEFNYISDINKKNIIEKEAESMLSKLKYKDVKSAHLFYTGGTKSEVVHIYNSFRNNKQTIGFSFSYLSARDFRIYFDDSDEITSDLRKITKISFNNLCKLHSFKLKEGGEEFIIYEKAIMIFTELIQNDKIYEYFDKDNGYNRELFLDKKNDLADKISKITKTNLQILENYQPNETYQRICNSFPEDYNPFPNGKFNKNLKNRYFKNTIKDFLDGKWLEIYCKKTIENSSLNYDEILINQEPFKTNSNNKFELDVLLMKGYQIAGISCTVSDSKHLCKSKGFEIILRTRQIGGAEAKAILITKSNRNNTNLLQNELILSTGTNNNNILVLGFDDWKEKTLIKKITEFLDWR